MKNGRQLEADAIVFAIPAKLAAPIIFTLDKDLSRALDSIENASSVVVNLLYKRENIGRDLKGFGFVVPTTEKKNIIACGWISKKFSHRAKIGYETIRVFLGGQMVPHLCKLDDQELKRLAHAEIVPYLQIKNLPENSWLMRWPMGLPIYRIGHARTVQMLEDCALKHEGLFFAGASYHGLGIPDCVLSAEVAARKLLLSATCNMLSRAESIGAEKSECLR